MTRNNDPALMSRSQERFVIETLWDIAESGDYLMQQHLAHKALHRIGSTVDPRHTWPQGKDSD